MISFWLVVLLVQGGDVVAFAYPTQEECVEQRGVAMGLADVLAVSECFQTSLSKTSPPARVGL